MTKITKDTLCLINRPISKERVALIRIEDLIRICQRYRVLEQLGQHYNKYKKSLIRDLEKLDTGATVKGDEFVIALSTQEDMIKWLTTALTDIKRERCKQRERVREHYLEIEGRDRLTIAAREAEYYEWKGYAKQTNMTPWRHRLDIRAYVSIHDLDELYREITPILERYAGRIDTGYRRPRPYDIADRFIKKIETTKKD